MTPETTTTARPTSATPQTIPVTNVSGGERGQPYGKSATYPEANGSGQLMNRQSGWWRTDPRWPNPGAINVNNWERILSVAGGAALLAYAVQRRSWLASLLGGATSTMLLYRGVTGHCPLYNTLEISSASQDDRGKGIRVDAALTVNRSLEEAYAYWRNLENLPKFMWHVKEVHALDNERSHWVVEVSPKLQLEWDARITQDLPNQLIAWSTEPGATVENGGVVRFQKAPGDRGTEIHATIRYAPPGGIVGEAVAGLFKKVTQQQIKEDIRRFKQMLEAGEVATTEGQSRCE